MILISLKQWLSGQTNCYLRFTQDTKIKIAVIQKNTTWKQSFESKILKKCKNITCNSIYISIKIPTFLFAMSHSLSSGMTLFAVV